LLLEKWAVICKHSFRNKFHLGAETTNERTCRQWVQQFRDNNFNVADKERCGRPSEDLDPAIQDCLDKEKYATSRSIVLELGVCHRTILQHLNHMGIHYLSNRWIPHILTDEQRTNCERICSELLQKYLLMISWDNVLRWIMTAALVIRVEEHLLILQM
jgi:hypothetical protein